MGNISELYQRKFKRKVGQYNKPMSFPSYLVPFIEDKKRILVAELGAGPICTIGNDIPGVDIEIMASDILWPEYSGLWKESGTKPLIPITSEDFEHLSYGTDLFDIVHCVNALDHTKNPENALREMYRICRPGGWIYLRHSPNQKSRYRGHHYWDIYIDSVGRCVFSSKTKTFILEGFTTIVQEDGLIVSTWKKI